MSVTFKVIGALETEHEVECLCVHPDEGPEADCRWCNGTGLEIETRCDHEHNFSNSNAVSVLGALGFDTEDLRGTISFDELPNLRQRVLRALNSKRTRSAHLREAVEVAGGYREDGVVDLYPQPNVFAMGLDDDGLRKRIEMIDALCEAAVELKTGISWW